MIYRRGILSVSRGKHNRGIEYSFPPFKTSIPIIAFRGHSYRFRPNPKAIVLGGNEPFFIGEWRLVAGVIHRQIKGSPLANVQTDEAWCFGGGAGLKGIFQKVSQKRTELRLRNNRLLLHLNHSLQIGFLEEGLLCIVVQNGIHSIIFAKLMNCIGWETFSVCFHIGRHFGDIAAFHTAL